MNRYIYALLAALTGDEGDLDEALEMLDDKQAARLSNAMSQIQNKIETRNARLRRIHG